MDTNNKDNSTNVNDITDVTDVNDVNDVNDITDANDANDANDITDVNDTIDTIVEFYADKGKGIDIKFLRKAIETVHPLLHVIMKNVFEHYNVDCELARKFTSMQNCIIDGKMILINHEKSKYLVYADIVNNEWSPNIGEYITDKKLFHKLACASSEILAYIKYLFIRLESRVWRTPGLRMIFNENYKHIISMPKGKTCYISICHALDKNIGVIIKPITTEQLKKITDGSHETKQ